jgi:hypothetical protein
VPAIAKKTAKQVRRIVEMWAAGYSIGHMAKVERLSRPTVRRWLADEGIDTTKAPARAQAAEAEAKAKRSKTAFLVVKALELVSMPGEPQAIGLVRGRLNQIRALLEETMKAVAAGDMRETAFAKLADQELKYSKQLTELELAARPPEKPNADSDPENNETITKLTAKLETLVAREEKALRCCHCGAHPFR